MMRQVKRAVFFDLDDTVINGNSFINFIGLSIERTRVPYYKLCLLALFVLHKAQLLTRGLFLKFTGRLFVKFNPDYRAVSEGIFNEKLKPLIRPIMRLEIERYKNEPDCAIILLSGALDFLASLFSQSLGLDGFAATRSGGAKENLYQGNAFVYGKSKRHIAAALCMDMGISLKDCVVYGDSIDDRYLLEAAGQGIVVHPTDDKIRRLAAKKKWRVISE